MRNLETVVAFLSLIFSIVNCGKTPSGLYRDDGKGHTVLAQKFSKKDVREISYDILNIMGFNHKPHPHFVDSQSAGSQFLLEVYNSISVGERDDVDLSNRGQWSKKTTPVGAHNLTWSRFNIDRNEVHAISQADSIISFSNRGHRYSDRLKNYEEEKQFWFDVSEISEKDKVLGAELRFWKKSLKEDDGIKREADAFRVSVKQIGPGLDEKSFVETELDELVVSKWEQGWLRFNVTNSFREWILKPASNYGLVLSLKRADSGDEISMKEGGLATIVDTEEHQPFLASFLQSSPEPRSPNTQAKKRKRVIRGAESSGEQEETPRGKKRTGRKTKRGRQMEFESWERPRGCQMGMLYVNFDDLGWKDWVIAPDGFIAYYCTGECSFPLTATMNATNHAVVSTLMHTFYPTDLFKASCAPIKLGSISMLYYDDNSNVTVKKYKDMVIKSCGCK